MKGINKASTNYSLGQTSAKLYTHWIKKPDFLIVLRRLAVCATSVLVVLVGGPLSCFKHILAPYIFPVTSSFSNFESEKNIYSRNIYFWFLIVII